jgi:hypothetical protein
MGMDRNQQGQVELLLETAAQLMATGMAKEAAMEMAKRILADRGKDQDQ